MYCKRIQNIMIKINPTQYYLKSYLSQRDFQDSGWQLSDPQDTKPSLIKAVYSKKRLDVGDTSLGIYRFADWLPIQEGLEGSFAPITYKSEALAKQLNINNLYITFSGYWPERGIEMSSCSFKETEAYSVCGRLGRKQKRALVVASAGNTARAFAKVCSANNIPLVIVIPENNLDAMWFEEELNDCVKIICSPKGSDYFDAIDLASKLYTDNYFLEEGGAKNIARRDGMGTTVLSATTSIGQIPNLYFQAVGSGTGTIAAHEANIRLIEDGRFGDNMMKLIPSQNIPFIPMYQAWQNKSRELPQMSEDEGRDKASQIVAKVLSNRKPPYSIVGGLYDCLKATNGDFEITTNEEIIDASQMFKQLEGIDIHPAAGCTVASLIKYAKRNLIKKDEIVMINITGGGEARFKKEKKIVYAKANLIISPSTNQQEIIAKVKSLF